ncbi:F0F1 ATP synthase subunit B [Sulfurimonas sp. HSL-1716]|uniref:F0F1 ATP synthase subunit B n=1 Tax=Hydrocurvibacter sulfurireducens TaxID=3131937 RepID=UPI0031F889CD
MSRIVLLMLMVSTYALASEQGGGHSTDILWRTINFVVFAGIIWYFVAEPAKSYFSGRSRSISDELQKVQDKLNESKAAKEKALQKIQDSEKLAKEILEAAKKENKVINDNIMNQCNNELEIIGKQSVTMMEFEKRKMVREVVNATLNELLTEDNNGFDKKAMVDVILKKVA